jgi:hypothetical protein
MVTKTKLALAALLMVGIATAAQAGGRDDADYSGGYQTGPLGNTFGSGVNPVDHPSSARGAYASAARIRHAQPAPRRPVPVEAGRTAYGQAARAPMSEPNYMAVQTRFYRETLGQ